MTGLLLDTHVVVWMAAEPERLSRSFLQAIREAEVRLISHVTAWEIQIKNQKHRSQFAFSVEQLEKTMKAFSCTELPIEYEDIRALDRMRFIHSDPFDQLLMSQASRRSARLATLDQNIVKTFHQTRAFDLLTDRHERQ